MRRKLTFHPRSGQSFTVRADEDWEIRQDTADPTPRFGTSAP